MYTPHTIREYAPFLWSANPNFHSTLQGEAAQMLADAHAYDLQWFSSTDTLQIEFPSLIEKNRFLQAHGIPTQGRQDSAVLFRMRADDYIALCQADGASQAMQVWGARINEARAQARALGAAQQAQGLPPAPPPRPAKMALNQLLWDTQAQAETDHEPGLHGFLAENGVQEIYGVMPANEAGQATSTVAEAFIFRFQDAQANEAFQQAAFGEVLQEPSEASQFSFALTTERLLQLNAQNNRVAQALCQRYQALTDQALRMPRAPAFEEEDSEEASLAHSGPSPVVHLENDVSGDDSGPVADIRLQQILTAIRALQQEPANEIDLQPIGSNQYRLTCTKINSQAVDVEAELSSRDQGVDIKWQKGRYEDFYLLSAMAIMRRAKNNPSITQLRLGIAPPEQAEAFREALATAMAKEGMHLNLALNNEKFVWDGQGKSFSKAPAPEAPRAAPRAAAAADETHPPLEEEDEELREPPPYTRPTGRPR